MIKKKPLFYILLFTAFAFSSSAHKTNEVLDTLKNGLLDTLVVTKPEKRLDLFMKIYTQKLWGLDNASALCEFDLLENSPLVKKDKGLQIAVLTVKGLYYQQRVPNGYGVAIDILKQALAKAQHYHLKKSKAQITHFIGFTYYLKNEYHSAFEYMFKAEELMKDIGYDQVTNFYQFSYRMSVIYFYFANYERAGHYIDLTIKYGNSLPKVLAYSYGLKGNIAYENKDYNKACIWFEKALAIAVKEGDSLQTGIFAANLGQLYLSQEKYILSRSYLNQGYDLLKRERWDCKNTISTILLLALLEVKEENTSAAKDKIELLKSYESRCQLTFDLEQKADYHTIMTAIYSEEASFKLAKLHQDSLLLIKDSIQLEKDANIITNLEIRAMTERYLADVALMKEKEARQRLIRNISFVLLGMIIFIFMILVYGLRKRQKQREEILSLRYQKAEEQLDNYRNKLRFFIEGIRERNHLINELQRKKEEEKLLEDPTYSDPIFLGNDILESLYESVILTDADWHNFKILFQKAYPGFFHELQAQYPELTTAEHRILSLIKLDLSISEMSGMLGISPESVRQSRWRLWKKLKLKGHKQIPEFIDKVLNGEAGAIED